MKILITVVALMASCSSSPHSLDNKSTPATTPKQLQLKIPKQIWEPVFFKAIDERANLSSFRTLRSAPLPNGDLEVRVWHDFALRGLVGLVLRRESESWSAFYLPAVARTAASNESQRSLPAPKSGWDTGWQRLYDAGILSLPDAADIGCSSMVNDGAGYVVEYNYDGTYRTYLYDNPDYAKCKEAKRMIQIGNILSEEFGVPNMATR